MEYDHSTWDFGISLLPEVKLWINFPMLEANTGYI